MENARSEMHGPNENWMWCRDAFEHPKTCFVAVLFQNRLQHGGGLSNDPPIL